MLTPFETVANKWQPGQIIVITGPTGTGKTDLSLDLADWLTSIAAPAEIVNADAMQLYRGLDIGTAKLPPADRRGHPHHLFDLLEVSDKSTVANYQSAARAKIVEIQSRKATPILVGGSGLYISAVIYDFQFPPQDLQIRARLEAEYQTDPETLIARLKTQDPVAAMNIDLNNARRVIRALEAIEITGQPFSSSLPENAPEWQPALQIYLDGDRERLRDRLKVRAEQMFGSGLLEETRSLLDNGLTEQSTAGRAIGYAQAIAVIQNRMDISDAIEDTWVQTARYARRQRSWFNRYQQLNRLDYESENLLKLVQRILRP